MSLISELRAGEQIKAMYLLREKKLLPFREKPGKYLSLVLADRTGVLKAKLWDNAEETFAGLKCGCAVRVEGRTVSYAGSLSVDLSRIELCDSLAVNPADYLPAATADPALMLEQLQSLMATISNPYLQQLLEQFFGCPERVKAYVTAPAAKMYHHARLGGLLEHTLHVTRICESFAAVYPGVDRDLLLTGAIFHDAGKTEELVWPGIIEYTDSGKLLGHIVIGINQIKDLIASISGFPPELELKLLHLIASHHGKYEWQSPKRPKLLEASLLHHADLTDAEADQFIHAPEEGSGNWSAFSKALGRSVYKG